MNAVIETLRQKRVRFTRCMALLIQKAFELGYEVACNEVVRGRAQAEANASSGAGIIHSLHLDGLAVDLNLYRRGGSYITTGEGHTELGAWWKSLGPDFYWGGDFARRDYNHYSLSPDNGHTR
jgi:hypothetical protein